MSCIDQSSWGKWGLSVCLEASREMTAIQYAEAVTRQQAVADWLASHQALYDGSDYIVRGRKLGYYDIRKIIGI